MAEQKKAAAEKNNETAKKPQKEASSKEAPEKTEQGEENVGEASDQQANVPEREPEEDLELPTINLGNEDNLADWLVAEFSGRALDDAINFLSFLGKE